MRVIGRTSTKGGYAVLRKNGGIHQLMKPTTTVGKGLSEEFYEKTNVSHPFKSLGNMNKKNTLESIKLKSTVPKKYISFNL